MGLDECESVFERASASTNEAEFLHIIQPLFTFYKILSVGIGRGKVLWRARVINDAPYPNISELSYPPSHLAGLGRLNDLGSPCFYVASREDTAIAEVNAEEGQLVQVAGFRIIPEAYMQLALIGEYSNIQKCGYMHFSGSDPDNSLNRYLNLMQKKEALRLIFTDKFFSHVLADPSAHERGYILSRSLASAIHSKSKESVGIVFPSVKDRGGFNIGIKPQASDRLLHNTCCFIAKVGKRRPYGLIEHEIVKSAWNVSPDGDFLWNNCTKSDAIGMYGMTKEEFDFASNDPDKRNGLLNLTGFSAS